MTPGICPDCNALPRLRWPTPLDRFCTPIDSMAGVEVHKADCPQVALPADVAAEVDAQRRALAEARGRAWVSSQFYLISGEGR